MYVAAKNMRPKSPMAAAAASSKLERRSSSGPLWSVLSTSLHVQTGVASPRAHRHTTAALAE